MNKKLLLFFFVIELIIVWIAYRHLALIFVGIVNMFVILFMFFDLKFDFSINKNLFYLNKIYIFLKSLKLKNFLVKNQLGLKDKLDFQKTTDNELFKAIKYFFVHYGFVLSVIILLFSVIDIFVFKNFKLNLIASIMFLIVSFLFSYKELLSSNIYFWNRLISPKDIIFLFNIIFIITMIVFLKDFILYERFFYSFFAWIIFYLFAVYMLDYTQSWLKLFKSYIIWIYLLLFFMSFIVFLYFKIPAFKKFFIIKEQIIVEKPLNEDIKKENNFFVYIAPNGITYDIFQTLTWVYFTWYDWQVKYFSSLQEAKININNVNSIKIEENKNLNNSKNVVDSNNKETNLSGEDNLFHVMNALLNDEQVNANGIELQKDNQNNQTNNQEEDEIIKSMSLLFEDNKTDKEFTYYDVIPYIVNKFNLLSDDKPNIKLNYIKLNDPNYKAFKTAYYYKMFGKNSDINTRIKCQNLAVIVWLANNWNLIYTKENVFDIFWDKAIENWYKFDKCCQNKFDYINLEKISCILK